ncbi:hypothetical protein I8D64_10170 [Brachybacterium sp. MASK1Z-5]|uniref:EamA domain-containing protein n=1 Tax=Brachybacterium halotolerans TaxID=2795215 RepID=A0ABS1BAV9_9MICO|nr:hypothetical protein [Brachybacterium halotolerans]MBK0331770.1 hypothetical protein [Brachybacterium halotolerans]
MRATEPPGTDREVGGALLLSALALVVLLASTWILVAIALQDAPVPLVSAGRSVFVVMGLGVLASLASRRGRTGGEQDPAVSSMDAAPAVPTAPAVPAMPARTTVLLALTGVTGYTVASTAAIALAGPDMPALILTLGPAVVMAMEAASGSTRAHRREVVATLAAVAATALYVAARPGGGAGGGHPFAGAVCALAAMLLISWYGVAFARANRGFSGSMARRILPIHAIGVIPLMLWAAAAMLGGDRLTLRALLVLVLLGIVVYVPVYLLQHRIIVRAGATFNALLGLVVPILVGVVSTLLGMTAPPGSLQWCAGLAALAAMGVVVISRTGGAGRARPRAHGAAGAAENRGAAELRGAGETGGPRRTGAPRETEEA